jgi:hypothetical protein
MINLHSTRKRTPGNNEHPGGTTTTSTVVARSSSSATATAAQEGQERQGRLVSPFHLRVLLSCCFFFVIFSTINNVRVLDNQKDHSSNKKDFTTPKIPNAHENPMHSTNMPIEQLRQQELDDSVPRIRSEEVHSSVENSSTSATEEEAVTSIIVNKDKAGIALMSPIILLCHLATRLIWRSGAQILLDSMGNGYIR